MAVFSHTLRKYGRFIMHKTKFLESMYLLVPLRTKVELNSARYKIIRVTDVDYEKVHLFLRKHYFPYEPVAVATGLDNGIINGEEQHLMQCMTEGTSLMAVSLEDHKLLGVIINCVAHQNRNLQDLAKSLKCEKFAKFLSLSAFMDEQASFWKIVGESSVLSGEAMAVDESARGQDIGKALLRESAMTVTREEGLSIYRALVTSFYSIRLLKELGMDCLYTLPYTDYTNSKGCLIFNPPKSTYLYKALYYESALDKGLTLAV